MILPFPKTGSSSIFCLVLPITVLISRMEELIWRFCQLLRMSAPVMHSGTREMTVGWAWGPGQSIVIRTWTKMPLITSTNPCDQRTTRCFRPRINVSWELVSNYPSNCLFHFPQCIFTLIQELNCTSLWGKADDEWYEFCAIYQISSSREPSLFIQEDLDLWSAYVWEYTQGWSSGLQCKLWLLLPTRQPTQPDFSS